MGNMFRNIFKIAMTNSKFDPQKEHVVFLIKTVIEILIYIKGISHYCTI